MHAIASAARSAIGEAIFSRSYLYLQPGHLLPRSSSFLNSGYVVRTWSSSRSLKQEVGSESPGSEGKGKEREVESDRSEKSAGAGAGAGVAEEDVELPSEGNSTPNESTVVHDTTITTSSASKPKQAHETIDDIFADLFANTETEKTGDWDAFLGPVGQGIPKPRTRPASNFKPVTDYVPGFLTAPKTPPSSLGPRRNRAEMGPEEQMRFNTIIQDLSTMFEVTDRNIPKFPLESGGGVKRALRGRSSLPTPGNKEMLNTPPVSPISSWSDVSSDVDAQFDKLKEEISSLPTDADILAWMQRRVFLPLPVPGKTSLEPPSFPPTYPLVLCYLIALFRDRFSNPELSLAIFSYARSHSVQSYLVGCSTGVYNEMLKTRWDCFRDLAGVEEGVKEMLHHGVGWDSTTTNMISSIVEEILKGILGGEEGQRIAEIQYGMDVNVRLVNLEKEVEQYVEQAERKHRMAMHRQAEERRAKKDYRMIQGISL